MNVKELLIGLWLWICLFYIYIYFFCLSAFSRAAPMACGGSQARGLIGPVATGLHQSHGNARSLTHWARPGFEPATSWFLVGFISAAPWWELRKYSLFQNTHSSKRKFTNILMLDYKHSIWNTNSLYTWIHLFIIMDKHCVIRGVRLPPSTGHRNFRTDFLL